MMQSLLLRHNLSREDLEGASGKSPLQLGKFTCALNGSRASNWEHSVAHYLCDEIFPLVQYFSTRKAKRTLFHFYGPHLDSSNCLELFRELIVTIAAAARLRFGGYTRGSGASYAEGYVQGLPRSRQQATQKTTGSDKTSDNAMTLMAARSLSVHRSARKWLFDECGIELENATTQSRTERDFAAEMLGKIHGASHDIKPSNRPLGISHKK